MSSIIDDVSRDTRSCTAVIMDWSTSWARISWVVKKVWLSPQVVVCLHSLDVTVCHVIDQLQCFHAQ